MKKRLIILSDLWGKRKSDWLVNYTRILSHNFNIVYYDCCVLGEINTADYREENLHQQFLDGGIEKALEQLIELEKAPIDILAFSVGGTIAWKFGLLTGNIQSITCISSTRLRYENLRPPGNIALIFGGNDENKPSPDWFERLDLFPTILINEDHNCYSKKEIAANVCLEVINNYSLS